MRVLVTGGAGYIGSHAVRALRRAGHEVSVLDDLSRGSRKTLSRLEVPLIEADLRDAPALEKTLRQGWDAVLHFAAVALVEESIARPGLYWDVNLGGGLALLRAMRAGGCRRLVVSSTAAVYGEPARTPIPEDFPRAPINPYGASKLSFEMALEHEGRASGLRWLALRYFNAAGAADEGDLGERHDPETHLVPRLIQAARAGTPFRLYGRDWATRDGSCLRDFVHVVDLARAHVLALERLDRVNGHALNVGSGGAGHTVLEVVAAVEKILGKKVRLEDAPRRPGDPAALVAATGRVERELGFRPERTLEDAVRSHERFLAGS